MDETIRETFTFLNRSKIMTIFLSTTNKFLYQLCFKKFMSSPPLVLSELKYQSNQWTWRADEFRVSSEPANSFEYVVRLSNLQFIRFEDCSFSFTVGVSTPPAKTLRQISNLWDNGTLYLRAEEFAVTEQLASLVSTCRKLNLMGTNALANLDRVLTGKCEDVEMSDYSGSPVALPVETIVDFLFNQKSNCAPKLKMHARNSFNCESLIEAVKERFMASTNGCKFTLIASTSYGSAIHGNAFMALNEELEQYLHLKDSYNGFELRTP
ncbi:hypothetical protein Ddc_15427 [Ditylenchus destructor]|nr:hypothetical protein Ddc_15427 [Ditylenchus destructor]